MQVAYGWMPDSIRGTSPLWHASLNNDQNLKNAEYNYLITDYLKTPQLPINSREQDTWKSITDSFGSTLLNSDNQITLNLRLPVQYNDQESALYITFQDIISANKGLY